MLCSFCADIVASDVCERKMSGRRDNYRELFPCTMVCKSCPEYMYRYETLRETWVQACRDKGRHCYEKIKYYFNNVFDRHLQEMIFVIAYGVDHTAGIFLDFKGYTFFKEKMEKAADLGDMLPEISPAKLSRKTPQIMRIFKSLKDFIIFSDQLRHKNRSIIRQRHINGVYSLGRINEVMDEKTPSFLAFNAKFSDQDPKKILQLGCVIFSLESQQECSKKHHVYIVKENSATLNENILQKHYDDLLFGTIEVASLSEILDKFQDNISQADFLIAHSTSSEDIRNFLRAQGLDVEDKEIIDTLTLHYALFPECRKENSMEEILKKLDIPFDTHKLQNAGYSAFCIMQMFRALLKREFCECLSL